MLDAVESSAAWLFPGVAAILASVVIQVFSTVKRWHDRDKSGWWIMIGVIPIIGSFWVLI